LAFSHCVGAVSRGEAHLGHLRFGIDLDSVTVNVTSEDALDEALRRAALEEPGTSCGRERAHRELASFALALAVS